MFLGIWLGRPGGGCHADPDALENRARLPFPGAPIASDVFTDREHAIGRAGCAGARLVSKVKDSCVLEEWFEIAARMTRCPQRCGVEGRLCLSNKT